MLENHDPKPYQTISSSLRSRDLALLTDLFYETAWIDFEYMLVCYFWGVCLA